MHIPSSLNLLLFINFLVFLSSDRDEELPPPKFRQGGGDRSEAAAAAAAGNRDAAYLRNSAHREFDDNGRRRPDLRRFENY